MASSSKDDHYYTLGSARPDLKLGEQFKVEITGPSGGEIEIRHYPGGLSVWAWPGATTRAWNKAGEELRL
jgi:hypothetical protein